MEITMITKNAKIVLFASLIVAMVMPVSAIALENKPLTAEEEVAFVQNHFDKLYAANVEKHEIESGNLSDTFVTEQAKTDRIAQLDAIVDRETSILEDFQVQLREKYAVDPAFKEKYLQARDKLNSLYGTMEIPLTGITYGDDRKSISVGFNSDELTEEKNKAYWEELVKQEIAEFSIPLQFTYRSVGNTSSDESCTALDDDCDPIVGGVEIAGEWHGGPCSIGLPIKQGSTEGWITAGHCVGYGDYTLSSSDDDVDQPTPSDPEIGKATELIWESGCDCAFIEKNSGDSYQEKKVWYSSNYYTTMTFFTDRVADSTYVLLTGSTSGVKTGIVYNNDATSYEDNIGFDVVELTTDISANGDSGGAYTNLSKNNFYGIHKGFHSSSGNSIFIPWENIEDKLGL